MIPSNEFLIYVPLEESEWGVPYWKFLEPNINTYTCYRCKKEFQIQKELNPLLYDCQCNKCKGINANLKRYAEKKNTNENIIKEEGIKILIQEDFCNIEFIFDEETLKIFKKDFWNLEKKQKIIRATPQDNYSCKCHHCGSFNAHDYKDMIFCFDCKFKDIFPPFREKYNFKVINGYLAREDKNTGRKEYFHRFLLSHKINPNFLQEVHHKNFNKKDNRFNNLIVLSVEEHKQVHERHFLHPSIIDIYDKYSLEQAGLITDYLWGEFVKQT